MEQRSESWYNARLGKFTASEIYKLMGVRGLGETGKNYAIEKAIEHLFGKNEETFVSYDMQRGIELEPLAFNKFKDIMELKFVNVENCSFLNICDNSGASPDGLVNNNDILEIKCPKNETFFKLVATNEIDIKYLYQMQMQMLASKGEKAYFFNYIIIDGEEYHHTIEVDRDESIIELMQKRILEASEIKKEYINLINKNKQWK